MSRQVNINVNVDSAKAVSSINTLKKAFQELNKSIEKNGKDGALKIKVDLEGVDTKLFEQLARNFTKITKNVDTLNKALSDISTNGKALNVNINNISNTTNNANKNINNYTKNIQRAGKQQEFFNGNIISGIASIELLRRGISYLGRDYLELTNKTFGVGIAGQMDIGEINALNESFTKLATNVPKSASELAQAVDDLIRTGRSYDESRKIIEEVARLSVASGDNLKDTAQVVTKVMVSLGVNADRTVDTLNTMHSTAIQTASDMGYLAEAYKNIAGTTAVLTQATGLAGKELDDYKQKVLDLSMAGIGSMANLGLSASQTGTKMKNLFSRLTASEKVARNMFDEQMRLNNVIVDGKLFNFDMLANIAKSDLPRAVELMSKLYINGQLSSQVVQKMFTARHFMEISNLLIQINGDVDTFVNGIARGIDYSNDMYKAMFNLSEQSKLLGNNLKALIQPALETSRKSLTGIAMVLNNILKDANGKEISRGKQLFQDLSASASAGTIQLVSLGLAMKTLLPLLKAGGTGIAGLLGASVGTGGAIAIGVGALTAFNYIIQQVTKGIYELEEKVFDVNEAFRKIPQAQAQAQSALSATSATIKSVEESIKVLNELDMSKELKNSFTIDPLLKEFKELYDIIDNFKSLSPIDLKLIQLEDDKKVVESLNNQMKGLAKNIEDVKNEAIKSALSKAYSSSTIINPFTIIDDPLGEMSNQEIRNSVQKSLKKLYKVYFSMRGTEKDDAVLMEKITEYGIKQLGFKSEKAVKTAIGYLDETVADNLSNEYGVVVEKSKQAQDAVNNTTRAIQEQREQADLTVNRLKAYISALDLDNFKRSGIFEMEGKEYTGLSGILAMSSSNFTETIKQAFAPALKQQQEYQKELATLWNEDLNDYTDKSRADYLLKELETVGKTISVFKDIADFYDDGIYKKGTKEEQIVSFVDKVNKTTESLTEQQKAFLSTIDASKGLSSSLLNLTNLYMLLNLFQNSDIQGKENIITALDEIIKKTEVNISLQDKDNKEKANRNKYSLKHISYQKEELEMELALSKVGKTKGQQLALEYEYKLKTYKLNKELAQSEVNDAREQLEKLKGGVGGSILQKLLQVDPSDTKKAQDILKDFERTYKRQGQGEAYKSLVEAQKAGDVYVKALLKVKKYRTDLEVDMNNAFDETMKYISTLNPYEQMFSFSGKNITEYKQRIQEIFEAQKNEVWEAYDLGNITIDEAVVSTYNELLSLKQMMVTEEGKLQLIKQLGLKDDEDGLTAQQQLMVYLEQIEKKYDDISSQKENELKKEKELLEIERYRLKVYSNMGQVIGKLGDTFNSELLGNLSGVFDSISVLTERSKDPSKSFKWNFEGMNWDKISVELSKAFESAFDHMSSGSAIGSFVGGIVGGTRGGQQMGTLAGLATGLYGGFDPATSMAIQAGTSLIGGLFDKSGDDQAEAERRTKEANKIYNKNTEALQQLSQRMSELSGGVDSLNNSLVSSFSKIPTVGNLNRVTDAMTSMYKTMEKTRIFEDVAYQVTKTKKSKGFFGIGGGSTSWTETIEVSVQEMLNKYGFKGAIEDMTTDQLRAFSTWLDDYDMGDSDNFSVLADAIEDYAEALDKMEQNIENFFYDTTMESFEGISSLQQEELRQQIEDFYKNLGLQIDDAMLEQIDKLAEEMSVMITIMQDVRGEFINSWRNSGVDAGKAFVGAMKPYVDAMLTNISQIYYDVYFSDINKQLEDEFKSLSEKLVELKKQGQDLDWSSVAGELSDSFGDVINIINATKEETESFNSILLELQKQALESGLSLSEIFELGLTTGTQNTVIETFKEALSSSEADSAFTAIGEMVGDTIGEALVNKLIDNMMGEKILEFSSLLDKAVSGSLSFDSLAGLANEAMSVGLMLESERLRFSAIADLFSWDKDINYTSQESNISYEKGTSSSTVYNVYVNGSVEAGAVIESDSVERLLDSITDQLIENLKVNKGIDLKKLQ